MMNRPIELYNTLKTIRPDMFHNFMDYAYRYCDPQERPYGMDYSGSSNTRELSYILRSSFMIRRLKKEVLSQLPPKRRQRVEIQCEERTLKQVKKILGTLLDDFDEDENVRSRFLD